MGKNLFSHLNELTQGRNENYFDELTGSEKKTWSSYIIHRFLSMSSGYIHIVNFIQQFTLTDKHLFNLYHKILPKKRTFLRYIKSKNKKEKDELVGLLARSQELGTHEIEQQLELMTSEDKEQLKKLYGIK
tara:strand:- start:2460 stop:2852 length:393 start_codon:yes stop_codon:yes gene_type:complete